MRFVSITVAAVMLAMAFAPQATASHAEGGPTNLELLETPSGFLLRWDPPTTWGPVAYRVFADGQLVAVTEETSLLVEEATRYVVQAVDQDSSVQQATLVVFWGPGPTDCGYVTTNTDFDEFPFIFLRIHGDCFYWIWELINNGPSGDDGGSSSMENRWIGGS